MDKIINLNKIFIIKVPPLKIVEKACLSLKRKILTNLARETRHTVNRNRPQSMNHKTPRKKFLKIIQNATEELTLLYKSLKATIIQLFYLLTCYLKKCKRNLFS